MNVSEPEQGSSSGVGRILGTLAFCVVLIVVAVLFIKMHHAKPGQLFAAASGRPKLLPYKGTDPYKGFEIIPGTYQMTWSLQDSPGDDYRCSLDKLIPQMRAKIVGRLSSHALYISGSPYDAIVDGPGSQYNVAYVFPEIALGKGMKLDLAKALRVPLKPVGKGAKSEPISVTLKLGRGANVVTRQGELTVEVYPHSSNGPEGKLIWRGGWYGMLQTSNGVYKAEVLDCDCNGEYDNTKTSYYLCDSCGTYHETGCDQLQIKGMESCSGTSNSYGEGACSPVGVSMLVGKLYETKVSPSGDSFSIKSYTGPAGTVEVRAVDGFDSPAGFCIGFDKGGSLELRFSGIGSRSVKLPPGDYEVSGLVGVPDSCIPKEMNEHGIECVNFQKMAVRVTAGKVTHIKLGGPIAFAIQPEQSPVLAKHGAKNMVKVIARLPNATSHEAYLSYLGGKKIAAVVKNGSGKVVKKIPVVEYGDSDRPLAQFDAGALSPGEYTLSVSCDFGIYSPQASAEAKITVTP